MENIKFEQLERLYPAREHQNFRAMVDEAAMMYGAKSAFIIKTKMARRSEPAEYRYVSFNELKEEVYALGAAFAELGLNDKTIALIGENSYHWFLCYLTTLSGSATLVPLDKGLPYEELRNSIEQSYSTVLCFGQSHKSLADRLKEEGSDVDTYISFGSADEGLSIDALIERGKQLVAEGYTGFADIVPDVEKAQLLIFTSGTTSSAKAVMLCQRNLLKNVYPLIQAEPILSSDVNMAFLPYHHTFGAMGQNVMISAGATTVFCDGLKYVQKNLQEYHVSVFVGVPLIVESLYKKVMAAVKKQGKEKTLKRGLMISNVLRKVKIDVRRKLFKDVLDPLGGALRLIVSGASALDPEVSRVMQGLGITVVQGYGMTECSPVIAAENLLHITPGSIGRPIPGTTVEIDNPDENGIGELIVRSESVMLGYFENEEATAETLRGGWLHTGDLAYKGKEGNIHICGRSKNMIVLKSGKKVFPEEVEELIAGLPYVKENMVYAEPKRGGEDKTDVALVAKIVYDPEYMKEFYNAETHEAIEAIVDADILEINNKMPHYKSIYRIIVQEEEMIKTTTGKVKRFVEINK